MMESLGPDDWELLTRLREERSGKLVPTEAASIRIAIKLCATGHLAEHPEDEDGFILTDHGRRSVEMLRS